MKLFFTANIVDSMNECVRVKPVARCQTLRASRSKPYALGVTR